MVGLSEGVRVLRKGETTRNIVGSKVRPAAGYQEVAQSAANLTSSAWH